MAHTASGLARCLSQAAVVGLVACGGGGGAGDGSAPLFGTEDVQAVAVRARSACMAPGFAAQDAFVANELGAGSQQQVRFVGPLQDGGFAVAWLSRTPQDTLISWRLQWQRFDATGTPVGPAADLPYTEDALPQNVAVLVQPTGRIVVAYAVTRPLEAGPLGAVVNSVFARMFDDGMALPGQITVASKTTNLFSRPPLFQQPVLVGFDDGSFLVGWHTAGMEKPQLFVQRLTADGALAGEVVPIDSLGAVNPSAAHEQLFALPDGGWVAVTPWRTPAPALQDYTLVTQVGVSHPLNTPDVFGVPGALPAGSVLLQDARGLLVATPTAQSGDAASLQQFNHGGNAAGRATALAFAPTGAASLSTGESALFASAGGMLVLQRIGARGDPIGQPVNTSVPSGALVGALPGGGLVLIWTRSDASSSQVMAQLFTPGCSE